jgi:hypothetical protein
MEERTSLANAGGDDIYTCLSAPACKKNLPTPSSSSITPSITNTLYYKRRYIFCHF